MGNNEKKKSEDLSEKIQAALDKAIQKLIEEEKAKDGYLVISDENGQVKKVAAKDFYISRKSTR